MPRTPAVIPLVSPSLEPAHIGVAGPSAPVLGSDGTVAPPVRLRIPAIGVDAPVDPVGLNGDGTVQVPADWMRAGWYDKGPAPGHNGPAVILGHLDSDTGPALFWHLPSLRPGDTITIDRQDGSEVRFQVRSSTSYSSTSAFPTEAVYGATPDPELRLITCAGTWLEAQGRYSENLIVFATMTR